MSEPVRLAKDGFDLPEGPWDADWTADEINSPDLGMIKLPERLRCPNCGSGRIGHGYLTRDVDVTRNDDGTSTFRFDTSREPDSYSCADCDYESETKEPFATAARKARETEEREEDEFCSECGTRFAPSWREPIKRLRVEWARWKARRG